MDIATWGRLNIAATSRKRDTFVHEVAFNFKPNAPTEPVILVLEHSPYPFKREDVYYVVVPDKPDAEAYIAFLKANPAVDPDSIDYTQHP